MIFRNNLSKYLLASVSAGAMMLNTSALANPDGAKVVHGNVDISGIGTSHVIVDSNTDRAVVDWDSFSIGTGETTTINQLTNDAAILNRVTGGNVTEIFGTLESNGKVFLINESGILVGAGGVVETNGVVLSTLDVSNSDFLGAGDMVFSQGIEAGGGIEIHGKIRSISGGDIFILSREITIGETGQIDANGGYVGLGAGEEILLKPMDSGEGRISIRAGKGKIVNRGSVEGVAAELKAAGGNEYALAINNSGVVRAKGYSKKGGKIRLGGGGKVRNTGKLIARKKVVVRSAVKIENKGLVKAGNGDMGGEIVFEAPEIIVENGSLLDVSGALGGGRVFVGGGYQGSAYGHDGVAVDISENATNVVVESGAVISADATVSGDAGDVVVWSDDTTVFGGLVTADGGAGVVEISGKKRLGYSGAVSAVGGLVLFDPGAVRIVVDTNNNGIPDFAEVAFTAGTDVDGDGIDDAFEDDAGGNISTIISSSTDSDFDSVPDFADVDITSGADVDGDGIDDAFESDNGAGTSSILLSSVFTDADAIPDLVDVDQTSGVDADLDGIDDAFEVDAGGGTSTDLNININEGFDYFLDSDIQTTLQGGTSVSILTSASDGVLGADGDILIDEGVRIEWVTTSGYDNSNDTITHQATLLTLIASDDIIAGNDVRIQNTEIGNGSTSAISGEGGVRLIAGGNIEIGAATNRSFAGLVTIGSEFGINDFFAGVSAFTNDTDNNGTLDSVTFGNDGSVILAGGDAEGSFAQLGFDVGGFRGGNRTTPDVDYKNSTLRASNGDINVKAGGEVELVGGSETAAFAQIGHGGIANTTTSSSFTTFAADIVNSDITVESGLYSAAASKSVILNADGEQSSYAQIGHGSFASTAAARVGLARDVYGPVEQGNISGNILVVANNGGNVVLNDTVDATIVDAGGQNEYISQIGHGGHLFYTGPGGSYFGGTELIPANVALPVGTFIGEGTVVPADQTFIDEDDTEYAAGATVGAGGIVLRDASNTGGTGLAAGAGGINIPAATEIKAGKIAGNITILLDGDASRTGNSGEGVSGGGDILLGTEVSAATTDDLFVVESQIGHGTRTHAFYAVDNAGDGLRVNGDKEISVELGAIARFEDIAGFALGTDITISAGSVSLIAKDVSQNSAGYTVNAYDNMVSNQIGHGSTSKYFAGALSSGATADTPIDPTETLGDDSVATTYKVEVSEPHSPVTVTFAANVDLDTYDPNDVGFTALEHAAIQSYIEDNPADDTLLTGNVEIGETVTLLNGEWQDGTSDAVDESELAAYVDTLDAGQQVAFAKYMEENPEALSISGTPDVLDVEYTDTQVVEGSTTVDMEVIGLTGTLENGTNSPTNVTVGTVGGLQAALEGNPDYLDQLTAPGGSSLSDEEYRSAVKNAIAALLATLTTADGSAETFAASELAIDELDYTVNEGDIAGNITVYDSNKALTSGGITLDAGIAVGQTAITNDRMTNRIGHATHNYVTAHDANDNGDDAGSNDAGTITINQANILGANITLDTVTQGTIDIVNGVDQEAGDDASEKDQQQIELITSITAGLAKAEFNDATNTIGHGGEALIISGDGSATDDGNFQSGHGGDINVQRGTVWDGRVHERDNDGDSTNVSYGGSVDIVVKSSNQIILDDDVAAALSKAEANNAISQIGSGVNLELYTGFGGAHITGGNGGRGGDLTVTWDNNQTRQYGDGDDGDTDTARGIMGNITLTAELDGTLTGTSEGVGGYALDITSDDKAALSKADHNTVIGQIGHGDFMELYTGDGGEGGNLNTSTSGEVITKGQVDGGRGGDIKVLFNDNDNDRNDTSDLKIESDIKVDVAGAIRGEAVITNALSPEKHGLVETTIGHGTRVFAVAGNGADGGATSAINSPTEQIIGFDPDLNDGSGDESVTGNNGSVDARLRDKNGEILRGGAVGGDGGDVEIYLGDITDRYSITDGSIVDYYHDGLYALAKQYVDNDNTLSISGDSLSSIEILATHNEAFTAPADKAQSVFFHAQVKHALSEGPGSEVNAQIGHQARIQAQGGLAGNGGGNINEQVDFSTLQADFSGGNGGDVDISNGIIVGDIAIEAERQVQFFAEAGHGKETIVTAIAGHNTHLAAITRAGGDGGDLYKGLGNTDNHVQEYWETTDSVNADATFDDGNQLVSVTISGDTDGDGTTDGYDEANYPIDLNGNGDTGETLNEITENLDLNGDGAITNVNVAEFAAVDINGDGNFDVVAEDDVSVTLADVLSDINTTSTLADVSTSSTIGEVQAALNDAQANDENALDDNQLAALAQFIDSAAENTPGPATANEALFVLTLQDLNKDDQFTLGDSQSLGSNADVHDDNGYHDDGIGIAIDGNDAVATDKEVATATHQLLNQSAGVDQDLAEGSVSLYRSGVNPDNTVSADSITSRDNSGSNIDAALMVYDRDGNPQFIAVTVIDIGNAFADLDFDTTGLSNGDVVYIANTSQNRTAITNFGNATNVSIRSEYSGTHAFTSNTDGTDAQFVYRATDGDAIIDVDLGSRSGVWTYNGDYDGANHDNNFTYVDLNLDRQVDLVDFDADGKFDVVDIDQNAVYDRIDGRVGNTAIQMVSQMGHDNNGNANIIDYSSNTGMNYDASHTEGGWQVADLSHADGGRGGNASAAVGYTEGNIGVYTGNVNFADNEAYDGTVLNTFPVVDVARGAEGTTVTDSLVVKTDVQDNIVDTGGIDDTVISRIGHGAYQYADTAGESNDNKVGRTQFITDTDEHNAATGGDAGQHALNASGGDGGDGESILGDFRVTAINQDRKVLASELDHLVGDIFVNTRMSKTDSTITWDATAESGQGRWVSNGGYAFVADPKGDGISTQSVNTDDGDRDEKTRYESSANRVVVTAKVDNALSGNIGIAQIGHGAISIVDATEAKGGDGESGNGSEIEAHQTEIANGGHGGAANSVAHHIKGDIDIRAGRAPNPDEEITSIVLSAEEGPRIVPGSNGDIVVAQFGHGRIGYAGGGAGGESDDGQWQANGGDGGDAISIQRDILDTSINVNSSDLFGHGMDVLATALQGSNHIVRAQVGQGDINFAESNAGGHAAPSKSSVVEQWNQSANGGRGGDAIALQAGYNYDITVNVGSAPDTEDADFASLRVITDAQNIFLGTENHILANIGHGGYSHAESASAEGGKGSYRSALAGISTGDSRTPFSTYVSLREGGRGGNAISEIGIGGTGRVIDNRDYQDGTYHDAYLADDADGADITVQTHDRSYDSDLYAGVETYFNYGNHFVSDLGAGVFSYESSDGNTFSAPSSAGMLMDLHDTSEANVYRGRYDGILVLSQAGPGDNHTRAIDTNTAQIGHSGFNRADAKAGKGISESLMFGRIAPTNANGGHGIQSIFSADIQEGDGGNGGDAFAYTGTIDGDVLITNVVTNEANNVDDGVTIGNASVLGDVGNEDEDTNIVFRATGGTVKADHRVDSRGGHFVASEAVTDSNGGNAARPPQPAISFIAAVSSHAGAAGDASSIQGALSGDIVVTAENSIIEEAKKTTLAADEGFFVGVGHRLENDLEALGQGGISGMIGAPGSKGVMQATFKDDGGQDNSENATEIGSNKADEQANLLATYRALYEVKLRMEGRWTQSGSTLSAVDFPTAYKALSAYEKTLVRPVLGDPTSTGESHYRNIASETEGFYTKTSDGEFDVVGHSRDNNDLTDLDNTDLTNVERTSGIIKNSTTSKDVSHRFGSLDRNEGYGSGKNMSGIAGDYNVQTVLTVIFGQRDNDAATTGTETVQSAENSPLTNHDDNFVDIDEAVYGNIPTPSADEIEALRYVMAASGDGGNVRSIQGTLSGHVTLTAHTFDTENNGLDLTQANARGIYINSNDAALSPTDLFAVVGHGSELIKARAGDAGLHHDTAVQVTASVGGDGGDAFVSQGTITGNIALNSAYVIDVQAQNNGLGFAEEDTRIGHQLKVGSHLQDFATGLTAAVVAGIGGQDNGLGGSTRNGSGGDVTINQYGANGTISLVSTGDIADGDRLDNKEIAIRIFADNANISADHTEVHIGHDQNIDSAQAGDAGQMHELNTYETNKGLIGVIEGKGGDVTVLQALLVSADNDATDAVEGITISALDKIDIEGYVNSGKNRTLIGHDTTAGKEWQVAELNHAKTGNKLVAGIGGDSFVEMFDDVDGGEADSGTVTVKQGTNNVGPDSANSNQNTTDDFYEALTGDITITSDYNSVTVFNENALGGDTYVEIGHQLKLSAETTEAGLQRGITDQTAGDAGDILVTRGRIEGNVTLFTDGRISSGVNEQFSTDASQETEASGNIFVASKSGLGGIVEVLLGHGSESILKTGRSGFSQEFEGTEYDGVDTPTAGDAEAGSQTILAALQEIADKSVPNGISNDAATLTNVDKRDAIRLIRNTVSALKMAKQYTDRMTQNEQDNLITALAEAEAALDDIGTAELATQRNDITELDIALTYADVKFAARRAVKAIDIALDGVLSNTLYFSSGIVVFAENGLNDAGLVYAGVFGDHADGGDIRIDENDNTSAINAAQILGNVSVKGNSEEGNLSIFSGLGTGDTVTEFGHRLEVNNSTGEGAGETDGSPPDGGEAGDGGNIELADYVSGNVDVSANQIAITAGGTNNSLTHLGHDLDTDNDTGMADIFDDGLGNGGDVNTAQTAKGNITLSANKFVSGGSPEETVGGVVIAAVDSIDNTITVFGKNSTLDFGHMADQHSESDDDGRPGTGPGNSIEYNRAGDMVSTQNLSGNVTIDLDLDGDSSDNDLIIDATADASNSIDIMHDGNNYAFSGVAGHGINGDGQMVAVTQVISGDFNVDALEDFQITSTGGGINIGHDGYNLGISGDTNPTSDGDDYGELVTAYQNISGEINLKARRAVIIDNSAKSNDTHIGHSANQIAYSADDGGDHDTEEGYRDVNNNLVVADVLATQLVDGALSITAGEIYFTGGTSGYIQYGHYAAQDTATDHDTGVTGTAAIAGHQPGHIQATSTITGNMSLIADVTGSNVGSNNAGAGNVGGIDIAVNGNINFNSDISTLQFGHAGVTHTGSGEVTEIPNGSVNSIQTITSDITVSADEDLLMASAAAGRGLIGHSISEINSAMGTVLSQGHENSYLNADGVKTVSRAAQRIVGNITVDVDDYFEMVSGAGELQIGHESADYVAQYGHTVRDNFAQIGVSDQIISGDITVEVGTEANGTPNGDATNADDDANINGAGGKVHIGHEIAVDADNEVQIASGDIWLRVGADLLVKDAQIGHEGYNFADYAPDASNSYDLTIAQTAALAAGIANVVDKDLGTGTGVGAVRNRIQGNTTIGSAQNSAAHDSTLQADVMVFDGAKINSGYGGQGNKDVDGELRFFLPAQEGLTIVPGVDFNDSTSNEAALVARSASSGNVLTADGGLDHEHDFELMSTTAAYADSIINGGNFGFYFEIPPTTATATETTSFYTPYITEGSSDNGFDLIYFDEENGTRTAINIDSLADDYIGTSSLELACEEAGLSVEECNLIRENYVGQLTGVGSNTLFSGNAGGGQNLNLDLNEEFDPSLVTVDSENSFLVPNTVSFGYTALPNVVNEYGYVRPVTITKKSRSINAGNVVVSNKAEYSNTTLNQTFNYKRLSLNGSVAGSIVSKDFTITTKPRENGYSGAVVYGDSFDMSSSYEGSASYGQYVEAGAINAYQQEMYPAALSFASSYIVFEDKKYN